MAEQANYQGEHVGLSLNRDAVFALTDALEQLRSSVRDQTSAGVPLRLPDGRTLQLRLWLTNAGEIRDANGDYLDDDGIAHGDVTGDLAAHAEVRQVLNVAERSLMLFELSDEQLDGTEQVDLEQVAARRVDGAIDRLPWRYGRTDAWVEQLRTRAMQRAREVLPAALASTQEGRRRALAAREHTDDTRRPDPAALDGDPDAGRATGRPRKSEEVSDGEARYAKTPDAEDRYAYRGSVIAGDQLVERLIADGLASPAARSDDVDEVVWQVTEANAVDWNDPVDVHDFPRKMSNVDADEPVGRIDEQAAVRPVVRLRNRFDDDRRAEVDQARQRRDYAAQAGADGRDSHAGYWTGQADRWTEYAQQSRTAAIAEDDRDRAENPDGYARRLTATRTHEAARSAGSDGRSGEAEVPSWVTAAGAHARQANAREAEVPSWVTAAGEHARQANAPESGRATSDSRSGGAGMAM